MAVTTWLFRLSGAQVVGVGAVDLQIVDVEAPQARERADAAAEIVEPELAAHAVQHAGEALGPLHVGHQRGLGHLEAHL